jgi:hypothetical protein
LVDSRSIGSGHCGFLFRFDTKYESRAIEVYTLLLTAFTGVLGAATIELVLASVRQTNDARLNSRAYIAVEPMGLEPWRGSTDTFMGLAGIRNVGVLPARNLKWLFNIEMTDDGDREDFSMPTDRRGNQLVVGHSTMTRGTRPIKIGQGSYCFIWGIVEYDDGYGNLRTTSFCHRYNCGHPDFSKTLTIPERHARQHEFGNGAT